VKLTTLKDGQSVAITDDKAIALNKLGFNGSLMELIQAEDDSLDQLDEQLQEYSGDGQTVDKSSLQLLFHVHPRLLLSD
jgi:hypothetical protein